MHEIVTIGVQTKHTKDFIVNEEGREDNIWAILCYANTCAIQTATGIEITHAGDCFIKTPDFLDYQYTPEYCKEGFSNDWLYVRSDTLQDKISSLKLPVNTLIPTKRPELIRSSCQEIITERQKLLPYYDEIIHNHVSAILLKIARASARIGREEIQKYEDALLNLRLEIQANPEIIWTVPAMADKLNLSESHFSVLYKKCFGMAPAKDLIRIRIEKAKGLLLVTNMTLDEISYSCGIHDVNYFSRVFKNTEGVSPSVFRRGR